MLVNFNCTTLDCYLLSRYKRLCVVGLHNLYLKFNCSVTPSRSVILCRYSTLTFSTLDIKDNKVVKVRLMKILWLINLFSLLMQISILVETKAHSITSTLFLVLYVRSLVAKIGTLETTLSNYYRARVINKKNRIKANAEQKFETTSMNYYRAKAIGSKINTEQKSFVLIACLTNETRNLNCCLINFNKRILAVDIDGTTWVVTLEHCSWNVEELLSHIEDMLENEDKLDRHFFLHYNFSVQFYVFSMPYDRCLRTHIESIFREPSFIIIYNLDMNDTHKGRMLYATPQPYNIDHFVIIISPIKGKATCFAPFYFLFTHFYLYTDYTDLDHLISVINAKLMNDIEPNPGPNHSKVSLTVITLNCRGLGDIDKFRLLLNRINRTIQNVTAIVMLQETMILTDNYLQLAWRGKYLFTPGTGNSQGCITLFPSSSEIISSEQYGTRGHCVKLKGITACSERIIAVYNIYAPNGYGPEKMNYFEELFDNIEAFDGDVLLGGDFNTTLRDSDRHRRGVSASERRIANFILDKIDELHMTDTDYDMGGYTWRRGQIMSKLDRILYRVHQYGVVNHNIDWTFTTSDHAAVITKLEHCEQIRHRNDHVKLDNDIIKNPIFLNEIRTYVTHQLDNAGHMNPHMKLEFAKMSIRTVTLSIMKREHMREASELADINHDIATNTSLLTRPLSPADLRTITAELEELNHRKNQILQSQGIKLAHFAKSRWYNEGEKSNKYFLNLLKRRSQNNEMSQLKVNGVLETDAGLIRTEVTNFYDKLYNSTEVPAHNDYLLRNMFSVEQAENDYMSLPITLDELWANLKSTKATTPGPDGMSNTYLKKLWHIIGPLLVNAWNYSIEINELPPSHKSSILRLIPKQGKDLTDIKNWRPITLSNCDHKLITRTYNTRLLRVISHTLHQHKPLTLKIIIYPII